MWMKVVFYVYTHMYIHTYIHIKDQKLKKYYSNVFYTYFRKLSLLSDIEKKIKYIYIYLFIYLCVCVIGSRIL